ncbi:MAG: Ig-like domain-containing protein [Deltaproteobacteria bacterium]|nr:Ig-like domain-containing protein [Deltaproteobacteria bacterium]
MRSPRSSHFRAPLVAVALIALAGCDLTHLDLDGGAHLVSAAIATGDTGLALAIDAHQPLEVTLRYDDGFEEPAPPDELTWASADPQIASFDGDDQIRGRGRGATEVTARYRDQTAAATLTVFDLPQALELQADDRNCAVGEQLTYVARLRYQHGGAVDDVSAQAVWTSAQAAIVTIDGGVVTGRGVGDTQVTASVLGMTASADVHVSPAVAEVVAIAPATVALSIGDTASLRATATFTDGNTLDATGLVRWESSLPALATVGADGVVRALAAGQVTITALRDGAVGTATITIAAPP